MINFYNNKLLRFYSRNFNNSFLRLSLNRPLKNKYSNNMFFLSFDCDTEENSKFYIQLLKILKKYNLKAVFAVPGFFLNKNQSLFKEIFSLGHEFMNHGYFQHTKYHKTNDYYQSYFFYNKLPHQIIEEDILRGHETLSKIIGEKNIRGFRTPHFGSFDQKKYLNQIYKIIQNLGYDYSSSSMPYKAYKEGQIYFDKDFDLYEIPLTGMLKVAPFLIFDSWTVRYTDKKKFKNLNYFEIFKSNLKYVMDLKKNFILNYYVDPRQVHSYKPFIQSLELLSEYSSYFKNSTYQSFINEIKQ